MRFLLLVTAALLASCDAAAQDGDSGSSSERTYPVSSFSSIDLAGPYDVVFTRGPQLAVRAEGDPEALERLVVRVHNGELWIGTSRRTDWSLGARRNATVFVTAPSLDAATISGSGNMQIDAVAAKAFRGIIAGSGDLSINSLEADHSELAIAGSGDLSVAGRSDSGRLSIAGSGDIDARRFATRSLDIVIAGSGDIRAHTSGQASVSLVGSGDVTLTGTDKCTVSKMGSGEVRCSV